jgi:hypothetical protein
MSILVRVRPGLIQAFFAVPPAPERAFLPSPVEGRRLLCLFPVT